MSISPFPNNPLAQVNPYFTELPPSQPLQALEKKISHLQIKHSALEWVARVHVVAIAAIFTLTFFSSLGLGPLAALPPLLLIAAMLTTVPLSKFLGYIKKQAESTKEQVELENQVKIELQEIQNWTEDTLRAFLREKGISSLCSLPREAYLAVIARYKAYVAFQQESHTRVEEILQNSGPYRNLALRIGWNLKETQEIPYALQAAFLLEILNLPSLQTTHWQELCSYFPSSLEDRAIAQMFPEESPSPYLTAPKGNFTLAQIDALKENHVELRRLVFSA